MGLPTIQREDAAPAYEDVFADHPVNGRAPSSSVSGYSAVPQDDHDIELHAHAQASSHSHTPSSQASALTLNTGASSPETLAQKIVSVFRPKQEPHVHCEACDVQLAATQRRANERHCCTMVAVTFIMLFAFLFFGVVIVNASWSKRGRR